MSLSKYYFLCSCPLLPLGRDSEGGCHEIWQKPVVENCFTPPQEVVKTGQSSLVRVAGPQYQEDGVEQGRGGDAAALGQVDAVPVEDHRSHHW